MSISKRDLERLRKDIRSCEGKAFVVSHHERSRELITRSDPSLPNRPFVSDTRTLVLWEEVIDGKTGRRGCRIIPLQLPNIIRIVFPARTKKSVVWEKQRGKLVRLGLR